MDERPISLPGWKIVRTIGKGSFGTVYEIEKNIQFGASIRSALKVISIPETEAEIKAYRDDGYDDLSITEMFRSRVVDITAEFETMNKLKGNSHIVSFEDQAIVQHDNDPGYDILIRMELLTALPDYINNTFPNNRIPEETAIALGVDICSALELCGHYHIIHRDIKPQNIFVNDRGDFKLGDFGTAKTSDHTMKATKTGTYGYMAPEVYRSLSYNASVDIYSLGMVLYWMLNERRGPFLPLPPAVPKPSQNSEALERRMNGEELPAPKHGSEELVRIVLKACAFDPKERYADPTEMKRDLDALTGTAAAGFVPPAENPYPVESAQPGTPDEKTVGIFMPAPKLHTDPAEGMHALEKQTGETTRIETVPNAEQQTPFTPVQPETPEEKTVGLFRNRKGDESKSEKAGREIVPKTEDHAPVVQNPWGSPQPEQKTAGKGSKKKYLMIAAAALLAVAAAVVLIVVLAVQSTRDPVVVFQDATFEKVFREKYGLSGEIHQSDILRITELNFRYCGLTDISDVAAFRALKKLDISCNSIGDISSLSGLTNLTSLQLNVNQISDISALNGLTNLTELYLGDNQISDISALSRLTNLTRLYLDGNKISDISVLNGLTNLTDLYLYWNQISDISALSGLTKLTVLNLRVNQISDISALNGLTNLTTLDLDDNQISDISALSGLTNLRYLNLKDNRISDISALSGLTNLSCLNLDDNQISDISASTRDPVVVFQDATFEKVFREKYGLSGEIHQSDVLAFTELDLCDCGLTDISDVAAFCALKKLDISWNSIGDISALSGLTNLTNLNLAYNSISDISALSGLTNLRYLNLKDNRISDISALSGLTNLLSLDLKDNRISDISALSGLTNLTYLVLDGNHQIQQIGELQSKLPGCAISFY